MDTLVYQAVPLYALRIVEVEGRCKRQRQEGIVLSVVVDSRLYALWKWKIHPQHIDLSLAYHYR
jgi:hypothetical protein